MAGKVGVSQEESQSVLTSGAVSRRRGTRHSALNQLLARNVLKERALPEARPVFVPQVRTEVSKKPDEKSGGFSGPCKEHEGRRTLAPVPISATATATAATPSTGRSFFTGPGFIDREGPALEVLLVEHSDCLARIFLRSHFDEGEATRPTGGTVLHNIDRDHPACLSEVILQIIFCCGERQVTNE